MIDWFRKYKDELQGWKSFFEHFINNPLYPHKPANIYALLKTHKSELNILEDMPLRLITSCEGTPLLPLNIFIQFYVQPVANTLPDRIPDVFIFAKSMIKFNN